MISFRRHQHRKATSELLANMEHNTVVNPYQQEPITSQYSDAHITTTVIKNSIYRDSMLVEGETLANGISGGGSVSNGTANGFAAHQADQPITEGGAAAAHPKRRQDSENRENIPHKSSKHKKKSKRKHSHRTAMKKDFSPPKCEEEVVLKVQNIDQLSSFGYSPERP